MDDVLFLRMIEKIASGGDVGRMALLLEQLEIELSEYPKYQKIAKGLKTEAGVLKATMYLLEKNEHLTMPRLIRISRH